MWWRNVSDFDWVLDANDLLEASLSLAAPRDQEAHQEIRTVLLLCEDNGPITWAASIFLRKLGPEPSCR
jgi:hypothetical protein